MLNSSECPSDHNSINSLKSLTYSFTNEKTPEFQFEFEGIERDHQESHNEIFCLDVLDQQCKAQHQIQEECLLSDSFIDENDTLNVHARNYGTVDKSKRKIQPEFNSPELMNLNFSSAQIQQQCHQQNIFTNYLQPSQEQETYKKGNWNDCSYRGEKTIKRLQKEKNICISLNPSIKEAYYRNKSRSKKWFDEELISIIKIQKVRKQERLMMDKIVCMNQIMDELMRLKHNLSEEVCKMDETNRNVLIKLQEMQAKLQDIQQFYCQSPRHPEISFSKNQSSSQHHQSNSNRQDDFSGLGFAKTFINSVEELELSQVEEEENVHTPLQKAFIELLYLMKKKVESDEFINISQGLMNRVTSGPTLRSWIKTIDTEITRLPSVSQFNKTNQIEQFLTVLQSNQQTFVRRMKNQVDKISQYQNLQFSCWLTLIGLIVEDYQNGGRIKKNEIRNQKREQIEMNMGKMGKSLRIISMKASIFEQKEDESYFQFISKARGTVENLVNTLY